MKIFKLFCISLLCCLITSIRADALSGYYYFYFWADSYRVFVGNDNRAYINTHVKTSDMSKFNFTIDGNAVASNMLVVSDEVVDFPMVVGSKYTSGKDRVIVCSSKATSQVNFKQEICLNIRLIH